MTLLPIHPMVVHFPIALVVVAFILDLLSYFIKKDWAHSSAIALTYFAAFGTLAALLSGFLFTRNIEGYIATLKDTHVIFACLASIFILISAIVSIKYTENFKKNSTAFTVCLFISTTLMILTALKGSTIVYAAWEF